MTCIEIKMWVLWSAWLLLSWARDTIAAERSRFKASCFLWRLYVQRGWNKNTRQGEKAIASCDASSAYCLYRIQDGRAYVRGAVGCDVRLLYQLQMPASKSFGVGLMPGKKINECRLTACILPEVYWVPSQKTWLWSSRYGETLLDRGWQEFSNGECILNSIFHLNNAW